MNGRRVELFMIVSTSDVTRQLRRYCLIDDNDLGTKCPGRFGYHNGHTNFGRAPAVYADPERLTIKGYVEDDEKPSHDDPRWPTKCDDCAYVFKDTDEWDVFVEMLYERKETGEEWTLREAPPGAVWDCPWYPTKGPDGHCYAIMTPGGQWLPDLSSKSGTPWERSGVAPKLTCRPSILIYDNDGKPGYHGWLTDGVLVDC